MTKKAESAPISSTASIPNTQMELLGDVNRSNKHFQSYVGYVHRKESGRGCWFLPLPQIWLHQTSDAFHDFGFSGSFVK